MTDRKPSPRMAIVALAVLAFIMLGLSVPILVGGRPQTITLQSASVQAASRDTFVIATPVRLLAAPELTLQSGTLSMATDKSGRPRSGEAAAAILASGSARITLDDATIWLDLDRGGTVGKGLHTGADALAAPLISALANLSFETVSLRNCVIVLKRGDQTSDVLSDVRLEIGNRKNVSLTAVGSFDLAGRQLALDATLGLVSDRKDVVQLPLKATLKGGLVDASISDARLRLGDKFEVVAPVAEVQSGRLVQAAAWLGSVWPVGRGLGVFKAKGRMHWADRTVVFQDASFQLDGNEATGTLAFSWDMARPEIDGTLALKRLDLTPYMELASAENRGVFSGGWLSLWGSSRSLALPMLSKIDADVRISSERLTAGPWSFGKSAVSLSVKGHKMLADVGELELMNEGSARGQLSVDMTAAQPRYVVRGKIEGFDAAKAANKAFGHAALAGRANLIFDLTGSASTVDQLARGLTGRVGIELPDGGLLGIDVAQLAAAAQRSNDPEAKGWGSPARGQTRVDQFAAKFGVQGGKLLVESFKASD
ncbi:MAG: AsmA family protein, partial [Hyphomicrobiaceae bacterium]|nr:AsmA family protein [Hyphomicrobiaceae bacterium]